MEVRGRRREGRGSKEGGKREYKESKREGKGNYTVTVAVTKPLFSAASAS